MRTHSQWACARRVMFAPHLEQRPVDCARDTCEKLRIPCNAYLFNEKQKPETGGITAARGNEANTQKLAHPRHRTWGKVKSLVCMVCMDNPCRCSATRPHK